MEEAAALMGAAKAVPVRPEGMSAAAWAVIVMGVPMLGTILFGLQKLIPAMRKLANDREASIDEERRHDLDGMRREQAATKLELAELRTIVMRGERSLACAMPAIAILTAEVRRLDPDSESNAVLKQAAELMKMAMTGDFGFAAAVQAIPDEIARRHQG